MRKGSGSDLCVGVAGSVGVAAGRKVNRELAYRKAAALALREVLVDIASDGGVDADLWWDTRHQLESELAAIREIEQELQRAYERSQKASKKIGSVRGGL